MERAHARSLEVAAEYTRSKMTQDEDPWLTKEIVPLSADTAAVYYLKTRQQKLVVYFAFLQTNARKETWFLFCPTYSHIAGMEKVYEHIMNAERQNYPENFNEGEKHHGKGF
jgi:hypothetical protein